MRIIVTVSETFGKSRDGVAGRRLVNKIDKSTSRTYNFRSDGFQHSPRWQRPYVMNLPSGGWLFLLGYGTGYQGSWELLLFSNWLSAEVMLRRLAERKSKLLSPCISYDTMNSFLMRPFSY